MSDLPTALYEPDGPDRFMPTVLTSGPWDPRHQHAGPPSALLARAIERCAALDPGQIVRIGVDILRPVPADEPLRTRARVLRPGRRVEHLEAVLETAADGTRLMRATAWRLAVQQIALPSEAILAVDPLPGPDGLPQLARPGFWKDRIGYFDALEWRVVRGGFGEQGPGTVWSRLRAGLVAGEHSSALEHALVMGDAASGISAMLDPTRWLYINVNFDLHVERAPAGEWLAMDAVTHLGTTGAGLSTSALHDADGRFGATTQSLLVAPR